MQRFVIPINLILITAIAYLGVELFYSIAGSGIQALPDRRQSVLQQESREKNSEKPLNRYRIITDRDLFDINANEQPQTVAQELNLEDLKETDLQLRLWGTVSGSPAASYAVIEDLKKREQNLYRVDDKIQEATVKAILREKVILLVNGEDEILTMDEARKTTAAAGSPATRPRTTGREAVEDRAVAGESPARMQRISLNRSMIEDAMNDVSQLATQISITPHISEDGGPDGLALKNIKPNSIFRRMGLRNGDILTGVDGQEIQTVDDALKLYENLKSASGVQVQILRRGQERSIDYSIR